MMGLLSKRTYSVEADSAVLNTAAFVDKPTVSPATQPGILRVTNSAAQYDVSASNPKALANLGQALAGSIRRPDLTFFDPELKIERELGDVLISIDLSNPDEIVLQHLDSAGKGKLGRTLESISYMVRNPLLTVGMKGLGVIADPEKIYLQEVIKTLATLEQMGMFGAPGASTFKLSDWDIQTRDAWRDVVIKRKGADSEKVKTQEAFEDISFSEVMRAAAKIPIL